MIVPVGVVTSVPAAALTGDLPAWALVGSVALAGVMFTVASVIFRRAVRRYASASS